jgi:hypothetical protein
MFAPDTASDWWNFGVNAAIAIATVLAVIVSVITARTANKRADDANKRADIVQAGASAIALAEMELTASSLQREKNTILGEMPMLQQYVVVARDYDDQVRLADLESQIANAEIRVTEIDRILAAVVHARDANNA